MGSGWIGGALMANNPDNRGATDRIELILMLHAVCTRVEPGVRRHVRPLRSGRLAKILETFKGVSVLGIHSVIIADPAREPDWPA
jgi:hypothetical protein